MILQIAPQNPFSQSEKHFYLLLCFFTICDTLITSKATYLSQHFFCATHLYFRNPDAEVSPAIHIGFLNFTPFPEVPEFYATNMMLNIKNHHVFSDKFRLQCQARDDYYAFQHMSEVKIKQTEAQLADQQKANADLQNANADLQNTISDLRNTISDLQNSIAEQAAKIEQLSADLAKFKNN